jgi:glutamate synthase (NADPH/NADH)
VTDNYGRGVVNVGGCQVRRRVDLLHEEGIEFVTNTHVGKDVDVQDLRANWCVCLACHFQGPRPLSPPLRSSFSDCELCPPSFPFLSTVH